MYTLPYTLYTYSTLCTLCKDDNWADLEPGEHELLGWEVGGAQLVVGNQAPDQAQDQLHIPVLDISVSCRKEINLDRD